MSSISQPSPLDLVPYGGNNPVGALLYKQVAREKAPKLAVIFKHLVKRG